MSTLVPLRPTPRWSAYTLRAVSAVVVLMALAVPVGAGIRWWPSEIGQRVATPAAEFSVGQLEAFAEFADSDPIAAPLVISYHDIAPAGSSESKYAVTPAMLEEHMAMLEAAGFESISSQQMVDYLDGRAIPARSVLITFDDGARGIWHYADQILERHGFHATAFIITGSVGTRQPYYVTWSELRRMRDSGRWDFGGHTDDGHRYVAGGPAEQDSGPFLLTREWLADDGRLETLDEWRGRVAADLDANVARLAEEGFEAPLLFAHPYAAVISPTNDPAIPMELDRLVEERFAASVANNQQYAGTVGPTQIAERHLLRIAVRGITTTDDLFQRLRDVSDSAP